MYRELIKFLEIGKLEKGLFRVWVVLALIFYIFFYSVIFNEDIYKNFREASKRNYFCTTNVEFQIENIPLENFVIGEFFEFSKTLKGIRPAKKSSYWGILGFSNTRGLNILKDYDEFKDKKTCEEFLNEPRNDFFRALLIITFFPILVIFFWFFFKKILLWIYRGFK